jgi:hypothetical protein
MNISQAKKNCFVAASVRKVELPNIQFFGDLYQAEKYAAKHALEHALEHSIDNQIVGDFSKSLPMLHLWTEQEYKALLAIYNQEPWAEPWQVVPV